MVLSGPVHQIREAALRRNRLRQRRSLQKRSMFQVQECIISRMSKYKEERTGGNVDVNDREQHTQGEPSATKGKKPKTSKMGNSVLSRPNKKIADSVKDSPFRKHTTSSSNEKLVLKEAQKPNKHHVGSITCHLMIPRHFRSTTKVTSSITKTPTSSTSPMTRENCQAAEKHQSTMNQGQCRGRRWRI